MELLDGCKNKKSLNQLRKALEPFNIVLPSPETSSKALELYISIKLQTGIDFIDCLIGSTAVSLNLPLYTFNEKHFNYITDLKIIKPYKKSKLS